MLAARHLLGLSILAGALAVPGCQSGAVTGTYDIIIDNMDAEAHVTSGTWETAATSDGNGSYGEDFLYHLADQTNIARVRFTFTIPAAGVYTVYIYWSAAENRTASQPVVVHDANGDTTYYVNLRQNGNRWYELGSHEFNAGTGGYVEFNTNTTSEGFCNADAVRLTSEF